MEVKITVTKEERKALVAAIGELIGCASAYQGAPSFAFAVGNYIIDRNGTLVCDERVSAGEVRSLLTGLAERGFVFEGDIDEIAPAAEPVAAPSDEVDEGNSDNERTPRNSDPFAKASIFETPDQLAIEVPLAGFSNTALDNLEKLVEGKAALIKKAIGTDALPIERTESSLRFPWFPFPASKDATDAYVRFVCALCDLAKKQKRVTMKESSAESDGSEKFAFRCFLLRLGFVGTDYKSARKVLLSKLSGNGSFKTGDHKRGAAPEAVTAADSGEENAEAIIVREDENNAENAATNGREPAYTYDPDLSDYDALMAGRGN